MKNVFNLNKIIKKWAIMKNFVQKNENFEELKVQEYIKKYVKELQRHFDMSDKKIKKILYRVYQELSPVCFIKKWVYMVKSFCSKLKTKGNNDET